MENTGDYLTWSSKKMTFSYLHYESSGKTIAKLAVLLSQIDPDVGYSDWMRALMAIFYETGGSEEGFELADTWSSGGCKYKGAKQIRSMWRCFKPDHPRPVKFGTLVRMAKQV